LPVIKTARQCRFKKSSREFMPYSFVEDGLANQFGIMTLLKQSVHKVASANECLEAVRKEIRGSLTDKKRWGLIHDRFILLKREANLKGLDLITLKSWTKNYPVLGQRTGPRRTSLRFTMQ
jgi:hypothetical protein